MIEINLTKENKIALSGVHRTGKTTLAKKISYLTGFTYVPETAREMLNIVSLRGDEVGNRPFPIFDAFEKTIFYSYLFYKQVLDYFIADRTLLDVLVYCLNRKDTDSTIEIILKEIKDIKERNKYFYDVVLFVDFYNSYYDYKANIPSIFTKKTIMYMNCLIDQYPEDKKLFDKYPRLNLLKENNINHFMLSKKVFVIKKGTRLVFKNGTIIF